MRHLFDLALRCCAALAIIMLTTGPCVAAVSACVQPQYAANLVPASNDEHVVIQADHANASLGHSGISTLTGAVHVSQRGRAFAASRVQYNDTTKGLKMIGPSRFRGPNFALDSEGAKFNLNTESGIFTDSKFVLPRLEGHGGAKRLEISRSGKAQLDQAYYTTCAEDNKSWVLNADRIHLDRKTGIGTARDATLRFQGVPILWLPWFRFPIDDRRRTGLLFPTIGQGTKTGFDLRVPIYINLAPNYDDELTPRFMSRRGVQLNNTFRYLLPSQEGDFTYQYLNHDRSTGHERSFIDFQHHGLLAPGLGLDIDFEQASDINYFDDFGGGYANSSLADSSTPFLPRGATLTFHRGTSPTTVQLLAESYQPLALIPNPDDRPYRRLPELRVQTITRHSLYNIRAGIDGNLNNFERDNSVTGQRIYLDPYLSWNLDHTGWYLSSRLDGTWTQYFLAHTTGAAPQQPSRTLPLLSANAGLRFNRRTDSGLLQTLEPHLFYLFVPYDNQANLPIFDTGQPDFDFPELFARNRFAGEDRISDANHLTGVMTTRLINPTTGLVQLSASAGLIYRFVAPRVTLPGEGAPSTGTSDYVGSIDYRFDRHWETASELQWSPIGNHVVRANTTLRYESSSKQRISVSYHYREGLFNQVDLSFILPIEDRWHVAGRVMHSIREGKSLGVFGGVEYETCCWAVRAGARHYISNVNGSFSTGVFVQFTLKGLTRIGHGWDNLLPADTQKVRAVVRQ